MCTAAFPLVEDPGIDVDQGGGDVLRLRATSRSSGSICRCCTSAPDSIARRVNEAIAGCRRSRSRRTRRSRCVNYAGGHHGFEQADDNDATRQVIDDTLEFVKTRTSAAAIRRRFARRWPKPLRRVTCRPASSSEAAAAYASMVAARPDDARLRLAYGEALLGDGQAATRVQRVRQAAGQGARLPRDLGLPAARACLQKGDPEAAVAWLSVDPARSICRRPRRTDPAFAPLRDRADFRGVIRAPVISRVRRRRVLT